MSTKGRQGGDKTGGRTKGKRNKKTEQWEVFSSYCLKGGLKKFQTELNKLKGKDFVRAFTDLIEFHKPKLARTELTGKNGADLITNNLSKYSTEELIIRATAIKEISNDKG